MSQTAAHLMNHVTANVPVRQGMLSLPITLRVLLAAQHALVTPVLQWFGIFIDGTGLSRRSRE